MTPKQKYEERKRLRAERLLREEQRASESRFRDDDAEERLARFLIAFEKIADVMELWADQQADTLSTEKETA
jgi:hypothetical protein